MTESSELPIRKVGKNSKKKPKKNQVAKETEVYLVAVFLLLLSNDIPIC